MSKEEIAIWTSRVSKQSPQTKEKKIVVQVKEEKGDEND